ncbi:MAG: SusC/RagA family TonB-linked outer membrane protein, partial [Bacteroidales bacterium]|nr:SusC/RagA family TonB-linked outer membrane protein [Bacteroidales bacterium]
ITDLDGKYTITVKEGAILSFSYVGYETVERPADQEKIDLALVQKSELLDEIIVIGYGTQKKSDKTGAVSHITSEELNQGMLSDPIQGLQGKAAGVSITKKGGDPNAGFNVRIRGASGYTASSDPLYVIDGVPGGDPTSVASEDIESYNVLKDAASTAIYGSRGANGVIIITTKKGGKKNGETVSEVSFTSKYSLSKVENTVNVLDAAQIRQYAIDYDKSAFIDGGATTDWQDELYRTGNSLENSLSFSGGSEKSFYRASITNSTWDGVMNGTSKERTSAKMNITHKGIDDRLTLNANIATSFENNDYENYDGFDKDDVIYQSLTRNPTDPVYNASGGYDQTQRVFNYENPMAVINQVTNIRDAKRYLASLKGDFVFFEGFTGTAIISYIRNDQEYTYFRPKGVFASADNGYGRRSYDNTAEKQFEGYLTYTKTFNEKHNLNLMGGYSWREATYNGLYAQAENPQSPYIGANDLRTFSEVAYGDVGSYKNNEKLIGFFGRAQYNYAGKYYLSGSLRRDGSSKFGKNNKWGWFPTVAASWNMQDESFLEDVSWLDQLKLRGSYGISGNQAFGSGYSQVSYRPTGLATNPETGEQVVTFEAARNDNPDLKWEKTAETNIGIDFAFLNSKLSGSIEVYSKNTTDLLYPKAVSAEANLSNRTFMNAGNISNKGIELFLQAHVVNKSNFTYKTSFTVAHNKSKWIELAANNDEGYENNGWLSGRGAIGDAFYIVRNQTGHEVSEFYVPEVVTLIDGEFVFNSIQGGYTTDLTKAQRVFAGSPNPDVELGWSNNMTFYKNWTLDFSFRSMIGHEKYNATKMFMDSPFDLPDLNAVEDALDWAEQGRVSTAMVTTDYIEDASFVKLDFVSIGYNFNVDKITWLNRVKLFVVANNVFTLTKYSGADPEINYANLAYGWDQYNVYPNTRTITFGLNATF